MVSDSCKKRFGKIMMEDMELIAQEEIAPRIFSMVLKGEMVEQMLPGQFLHIRVPDDSKLLRRPISISEIDTDSQTCRLIYRVEGGGTAIFSHLPVGSFLSVMGPQGNGFDLKGLGQGARALIIGGGIGVPPLVQVAKQLHEQGVEVHSVLGFATKEAVILEEELKQYGQSLLQLTMDLMAQRDMSPPSLTRWTRSLMLSILVELLACSNMSMQNSMTIPAPTFLWSPAWLVGWELAMPAWCIWKMQAKQPISACVKTDRSLKPVRL